MAATAAVALMATAAPLAMGGGGEPAVTASLTAGKTAAPGATSAAETTVRYKTKGKIRLKKQPLPNGRCKAPCLTYRIVCTVDCTLNVRSVLVLPGNDLVATTPGSLLAGQEGVIFLKPNAPARKAIRNNIKSVKLRTRVRAVDTGTSEPDVDQRTFKIKL